MLKLKRKLLVLATGSILLSAPIISQAEIIQDWNMDLRGLDGLSNNAIYNIQGIDAIGFNFAPYRTVITDVDTSGGATIGDTFSVEGAGTVSGFSSGGGTLSPALLNSTGTLAPGLTGWEITFAFTGIDGQFIAGSAASLDFIHLGGGTIDWYVNNLATDPAVGNQQANDSDLATYMDGVNFASFAVDVQPGNGGVFSGLSGNGSDDISFRLTSALSGVFLKDLNGDGILDDLADLVDPVTGEKEFMIQTASDFDSDPNNTGTPYLYTVGAFNCGQTALDFCGQEDGSIVAQTVPEPSNLILLGAGILGIAGLQRKKK